MSNGVTEHVSVDINSVIFYSINVSTQSYH